MAWRTSAERITRRVKVDNELFRSGFAFEDRVMRGFDETGEGRSDANVKWRCSVSGTEPPRHAGAGIRHDVLQVLLEGEVT